LFGLLANPKKAASIQIEEINVIYSIGSEIVKHMCVFEKQWTLKFINASCLAT
jgi:hypothetical protein